VLARPRPGDCPSPGRVGSQLLDGEDAGLFRDGWLYTGDEERFDATASSTSNARCAHRRGERAERLARAGARAGMLLVEWA
jgi:hypothetical protein